MDEQRGFLLEIVEITLLLTLLIVRFFISEENNMWISLLNHFGLIIAVTSLHQDVLLMYRGMPKMSFVTGVFVVILVVLMIAFALIFASVFVPNTKYNDMILLLTLLVSLPARYYKEKINSWFNS